MEKLTYIETTVKEGAVFMFNTVEESNYKGDYAQLRKRIYENGVRIEYSKTETSLYVYWISSENMFKGTGTAAFTEFLKEFENLTVELTAVNYFDWYEKLGFNYVKDVIEVDEETETEFFIGVLMRKGGK